MEKPSIFIAVTDDGETVSGEHSTAIVPWWSVTKTVLAAAALCLVRDGQLELDRPLKGRPYSMAQLLSHRAGLPCYSRLPEYHESVSAGEMPWSIDAMLTKVEAGRLVFEPGTKFAYSNIGYLFVGQVIEEVTGEILSEALFRLVLSPLGIGSVRLAVEPADLDCTVWASKSGYHPAWVYHGLLVGQVGDAALCVHRLLRGSLLPAGLRYAMVDAHRFGGPIDGRPWLDTGYGLGLMMGEMDGAGLAMGHSASGPGSVGAVYHFVDLPRPRTIAVFANADSEGVCEWEAARQAGA